MPNNPFETADRRFTNLESAAIHIVRLHCEPVRQFLESVKSVYRTIDFSDEYQAQLGRLLWRFRCSVLFGLAPYDHEELRLVGQGEEISDMAERLPGSSESVALMKQRLSVLLEQKENPKLEWILKQAWSEYEPAAIFALMAMRKSFGTDLVARYSANQNNDLGMITSLEHLGSEKYSTLVMPGTLQYLSHSLFMKLFHRGEFRRFHILLYEGESLSLKSRMQLPDSSLFPGLSEGAVLSIEKTDDSDLYKDHINDEDLPIPAQIFGTSGEMIKGRSDGCLSRFLLCADGSGFYVAESERIRVWRPDAPEKLAFVYPVQLLEGDFVILEKGQRRDLLDHSDSNTQFLAALDATGVWRKPLVAMLLSSSSEEIADRMIATGQLYERSSGLTFANAVELSGEVSIGKSEFHSGNAARNLGTNISKWAEGQVYGPGDLHHLLALVQVLMESGCLQIESSPEYAARQWYKDLETLRAGRRTAGLNLSDQIEHLLEDSLGAQAEPNDGIELLLDNGMLVSVHQLAMISDQVSAVPESFLRKPV
jgi:hypothetical protein